jgi:hypothetical protein
MTVGIYPFCHHKVMLSVMILARHQPKKSKTFDPGDDSRNFTGHPQFDSIARF